MTSSLYLWAVICTSHLYFLIVLLVLCDFTIFGLLCSETVRLTVPIHNPSSLFHASFPDGAFSSSNQFQFIYSHRMRQVKTRERTLVCIKGL